MLSFRRLLLLTVTAISVAADAASVLAALKNPVDPDVKALKASVDAGPGSSSGQWAINVNTANTKLVNDINKVTTDIKGSATPTAAQAQAIVDYMSSTLLTDTLSALVSFDNKKSAIIATGYKTWFKGILERWKTAVDALFDPLIAKAPTTSTKTSFQNLKTKYDTELQKRITNLT